MDAERTETRVSRNLLEAVRKRAIAEGRDESKVVEEALRRYLADLPDNEERSLGEIFGKVDEYQRRHGVEPLSDEEAMKLAVEEQHAHRRGE